MLLQSAPKGAGRDLRVLCQLYWGKLRLHHQAPCVSSYHLLFRFGTRKEADVCQSCVLGDEDVNSDGSFGEGCLAQDGEALEDDEELKLFIMGEKAMFTKLLDC